MAIEARDVPLAVFRAFPGVVVRTYDVARLAEAGLGTYVEKYAKRDQEGDKEAENRQKEPAFEFERDPALFTQPNSE